MSPSFLFVSFSHVLSPLRFWLDLLLGAIYLWRWSWCWIKQVWVRLACSPWRWCGGGGVVHKDSLWQCAKEQSASSYKFDQYLKANKRLPRQLVCALYVGRGKGVDLPPPPVLQHVFAPSRLLVCRGVVSFRVYCLCMYPYVWVLRVIGVWQEVSCGGYSSSWSRRCLWTLNLVAVFRLKHIIKSKTQVLVAGPANPDEIHEEFLQTASVCPPIASMSTYEYTQIVWGGE